MKQPVRAAWLAAILLVVAAGCNNDALPPESGFATVAGTVVDATTSKPVAGAVVTIDTVLTATTDAAGKFSVANVPSGIVDYTVQANGYAVLASTANAEPGKPFELDVSLAEQKSP